MQIGPFNLQLLDFKPTFLRFSVRWASRLLQQQQQKKKDQRN